MKFTRDIILHLIFICGACALISPQGLKAQVAAPETGYGYVPNLPILQTHFTMGWEVLRSGFNTLDVALEAETYLESWTIETTRTEVYLVSPRARVRVLGIHTQGAYSAPFDTLLISETQLSTLLGINYKSPDNNDKLLFVELPLQDPVSQHFALTASPEYFISVSLTINLT